MKYAAVGLALVTLPAPAAASEICAAMGRLAAAARESTPFASIGRALAAGEVVIPGFRAEDCQVTADRLWCHVTDFVMGHFTGWGDPPACAGLVEAGVWRRRQERAFHHAYVLSGLRFTYGVDCAGCAGGTHSSFIAEPISPRRSGD